MEGKRVEAGEALTSFVSRKRTNLPGRIPSMVCNIVAWQPGAQVPREGGPNCAGQRESDAIRALPK